MGEKLGDIISKIGLVASDGNNEFKKKIMELEDENSNKMEGTKVFNNRVS